MGIKELQSNPLKVGRADCRLIDDSADEVGGPSSSITLERNRIGRDQCRENICEGHRREEAFMVESQGRTRSNQNACIRGIIGVRNRDNNYTDSVTVN